MHKRRIDKSTIILVLGIIMALVAAFFVVKGQEYYNKLVPAVYSFNQAIAPFTKIKEDDLTIVKIPRIVAQQQGVFIRKEDVIGKISKTTIPSQTPVYKEQIFEFKNNNSILAANLSQINDPGVVAYTIPTNQVSAVGGKIVANDIVHIIATMETQLENTGKKTYISKIIVPYAKVIDVIGKDAGIKGLTFVLRPEQVLDIECAMKIGKISFSLLPYEYNKDNYEAITTLDSFKKKHFSVEGE